jgi:2-dehydro-3-deoxyphosphooctonate aldolase (KDO 8-P synthase)
MKNQFILMTGPCVIESKELLIEVAQTIKPIAEELDFKFVLKGSFKKANRTSVNSFTGIGDELALGYLAEVGQQFGVETITDIHTTQDAELASKYVDYLQIPAFLSRQTDLLLAAGNTGKKINIKKAQFMSPYDMQKAAEKVASTGNTNILMTERGTFFGYNNLVVDFRSLVIMQKFGYPVIYDATHSLQQPSIGTESGGQPEFILPLAKAAVATGIQGLFIEAHPNPKEAKSDAATQYKLSEMKDLLHKVSNILKAL